MISFRQFRVRAKNLFRERKIVDPLQPVFSINKQSIKWRCKVCDYEQMSPINKYEDALKIKCNNCGKNHQVSNAGISFKRLLGSYQEKIVYVTNATANELTAKIKNDLSVKIRPRLVYHIKYECELAHKDFIKYGELIAMNTGVIEHLPNDYLNICDACAGIQYINCPRCGGKGVIPQYHHIQEGICFRCWGARVEKVINVNLKTMN